MYQYLAIAGLTVVKFYCQSLQNAFRDPSSPFHLPPGTRGPESPEAPADDPERARDEGFLELKKLRFDPGSFWEQAIVWGDHDAFQ